MPITISKAIVSTFILLIGLMFMNTQEHTAPLASFATIDSKQLNCLATSIYHEAGNESINGKAAVARVVMNRVSYGFAKTACAVVYQRTLIQNKIICQFSWVCEGKGEPNKNNYKYNEAKQVAFEVMVNGRYTDIVPKSTLFFHSATIDPNWSYHQVAKVGGNVFYSKNKISQPKSNTRPS